MALDAEPGRIQRLVLRRGLWLACLGCVAGVVGQSSKSFAKQQTLRSFSKRHSDLPGGGRLCLSCNDACCLPASKTSVAD